MAKISSLRENAEKYSLETHSANWRRNRETIRKIAGKGQKLKLVVMRSELVRVQAETDLLFTVQTTFL